MMKKLLLLLLSLPALCFGATATFTPDTTTDIQNPERGFYYQLSDGQACGYAAQVRDGAENNQPISLFLYEWVPGTSLSTVSTDLACIRAAGVKVIFSPVYCSTSGCSEGVNVSTAVSQLTAAAATLTANRDVIAYVRMGIIGPWGEWHDSVMGLDTKANEILIRDTFMKVVPPEIPVSLRYPPVGMSWFPTPVSSSTAFTGSTLSRLGLYNDCFMSGSTDQYTYPGAQTLVDLLYPGTEGSQRAYAAAQTSFAPFGGETCQMGGTGAEADRIHCTDINDGAGNSGGIMNEGPRYHLTYLNRNYWVGFMNQWISEGCYPYVATHIGYRVQYDNISHPDTVTNGTTLPVTLSLHNYGWSGLFKERRVVVTLVKSGAPAITCTSANDLRSLPPQASAPTTIGVQCAVPAGSTKGAYAVYLSMPDRAAGLSALRSYVVQPANANSNGQSWENTLGRFATGTTVTVN
jgi:hypothetical protein